MKLDEYSNSEIVQLLGERYKEYRVRVGLTQKEISEKTNVSVMTIHRFESGAATNIALSTIISLLRAIGMLENVDGLLPELPPSPYLLNDKKEKMQRVRHKKP